MRQYYLAGPKIIHPLKNRLPFERYILLIPDAGHDTLH